MSKRHVVILGVGFLTLAATSLTVVHAAAPVRSAASAKPSSDRPSFFGRLEKAVGLSVEQKEAVRKVLQGQREELQAVRDTSNAQRQTVYTRSNDKIRVLLTGEQQPKWDAFIQAEKANRAKFQRRS